MEQYDKSGPAQEINPAGRSDKDMIDMINRLRQRVAQQDLLIENLQQDIRRLKEKLDRHADYLNNNRG